MRQYWKTGIYVLGACLLLFTYSCDKEPEPIDTSSFEYHYFPLDSGKFWIYKVDSTIVKQQGAFIDSQSLYVKEEINEYYISAAFDTVYVIERSVSSNPNGPFSLQDLWTAELLTESGFRVEENLRFQKMTFPLDLGKKWEGNLFDNLTEVQVASESVWVYKDWGDYEVIAKGVEHEVNGVVYSDVIVIQQADHDFIIETRYAVEYYAPHVGLIDKQMRVYDSQCDCPELSWEEKATAGFTLNQTLIDHN